MSLAWIFVVVLIASIPLGVLVGAYFTRRRRAAERAKLAIAASRKPRESVSIPRRAASSGRVVPASATKRQMVADSPLWIDPVVLADYGNYHQPSILPDPEPAHFESGGGDFGGGGASASYDSCSSDSGSSDSGSCGGGCD